MEFWEGREGTFFPLRRKRIHRNRAKKGLFAGYVLPEAYGGCIIIIRLHANQEDVLRLFQPN